MKIICLTALLTVVADAAVSFGGEKKVLTWAHYHPELAKIFAQPCTPWQSEMVKTNFAASQPTVVLGFKGELIANAGSTLVHSTDGGRSWRVLCDVPVNDSVPKGYKLLAVNFDGCGVTEKGTILFQYTKQYNDGRLYEGDKDETYHAESYFVRSTNRGQTWHSPVKLDPAPFNCVGTDRTRFVRLPGGVIGIALATWNQSRPGKMLPKSKWGFEAFLYTSSSDGRNWKRLGSLGRHTCEVDLLPLPTGRILAAVRYQRKKLPRDPAELASPYDMSKNIGARSVYKQTALVHSDDGGRTWSKPRLTTGWLQQTACLARLSDGTVVLPFGHKDEGFGQRFLMSFDEGRTWSRTVYQLRKGGLYANSVVLNDDTIITVHDNRKAGGGLSVLRWRTPSRETVSKGGFFKPQAIFVKAKVQSPQLSVSTP